MCYRDSQGCLDELNYFILWISFLHSLLYIFASRTYSPNILPHLVRTLEGQIRLVMYSIWSRHIKTYSSIPYERVREGGGRRERKKSDVDVCVCLLFCCCRISLRCLGVCVHVCFVLNFFSLHRVVASRNIKYLAILFE